MKYFKPEILARCRSLDDDVSEAAYGEWEQAAAAYRARLKELRPLLPAGVKKVVSRFPLHDAEVLGVSFWRGSPRFSLLLRLQGEAGTPGDVVALTYRTVVGQEGLYYHQRASGKEAHVYVQHDEFDLDDRGGFFTHGLTFTDGVELEVRFHELGVHRLPGLVPASQLGAESAVVA